MTEILTEEQISSLESKLEEEPLLRPVFSEVVATIRALQSENQALKQQRLTEEDLSPDSRPDWFPTPESKLFRRNARVEIEALQAQVNGLREALNGIDADHDTTCKYYENYENNPKKCNCGATITTKNIREALSRSPEDWREGGEAERGGFEGEGKLAVGSGRR